MFLCFIQHQSLCRWRNKRGLGVLIQCLRPDGQTLIGVGRVIRARGPGQQRCGRDGRQKTVTS